MRPWAASLLLAWSLLPAAEVILAAPLVGVVRCPEALPGGGVLISATVTIPADAPPDLGLGVWAGDRHGDWFQRLRPGVLRPGVQHISIALPAQEPMAGRNAPWTAAEAALCRRGGLLLWSASGSRARLQVDELRCEALHEPVSSGRILDLAWEPRARCGERSQLSFRPDPFPGDPFDPAVFMADLVVTPPQGGELRFPAFHQRPMRLEDGGDRELAEPTAASRFAVRWRPQQPGPHRLRLEAAWGGGRRLAADLGRVQAEGPAWDGYLRVDEGDPRFFSVGGAFAWPNGPNLRSVTDPRCQQRMGTLPTPNRGSRAFGQYLDRLGAAGASACELWMSSWSLALEWRGDWAGFQGLGRYSQERAASLDAVLDHAWQRGVRINLTINNHGQASTKTDREWHNNPWNRALGGPCARAEDFFTDLQALAGQERLRRYLVGRYSEHPAVLGWKLFSEQDLTDAGRRETEGAEETMRVWHQQAVARWHALDPVQHPVTSHWCGGWGNVYYEVAPLLDYITIDAYRNQSGRSAAEILLGSTAPGRGLTRFRRPVFASEYGCGAQGGPAVQMEADHASGGWAALVSGHAAGPMLWWAEWIDQGDRYRPYQAVSRFLAGEDLRSSSASKAGTIALDARAPGGTCWARAWVRPGRLLGYLCDLGWANGGGTTRREGVLLRLGPVAPGPARLEWWDADRGLVLAREAIRHEQGDLTLAVPPFSRHLALKLWRE